tara:strand:+ start:772 stop:1380 length:609 start_codon:yes stop_codon:yes gene_type:complete
MGLVTKIKPIGVDLKINSINKSLYSHLINESKWINYEAYHRVYANETEKGIVPEAYTEQSIDSNDYKEVFLNDNFSSSFFTLDDNIDLRDRNSSQNISIYFQLNVKELYPNVTHRADEEARNDVIVALKKNPHVNKVLGVVKGMRNVYEGFDTSQIKWTDMNPFHVFRVDITTNVNYSCDWFCAYGDTFGGFEYTMDFGMEG